MQSDNTAGAACEACEGKGRQLSALDGLFHVCPSCDGTGVYVSRQAQPIWLAPIHIGPYPEWVPTWDRIVWACKH